MKTIAICNHKGGVGKTALSMAIAEGLHRKGKRGRRDQPVNQLKENLIWIALGIPGMVLIGLVLHSLVHFETGVLVITLMILGTLLMVFCEALCKAAHDGELLSEMKKAATKSNFDLDGKGKLGEENEDGGAR